MMSSIHDGLNQWDMLIKHFTLIQLDRRNSIFKSKGGHSAYNKKMKQELSASYINPVKFESKSLGIHNISYVL